MNLLSCLSPVKIRNQYSNEIMYVPCRKCYACRINYSTSWRVRLIQESLVNKYVIFFTLTYDDKNLPFLYHKDFETLVSNRDCSLSISYDSLDSDSICYCDSRDVIPQLFVPDIQKFIKRLRKNTNAKIRYFITGEYGPRTYRSHYHGLFFTNSEEFATKSFSYISKAWQLGFVSSSLAAGKAIGYVTKYVNGNSDLPKIYSNKILRSKCLVSRFPALGTSTFAEEEIRKIIVRGIVRPSFFNGKNVIVSTLWPTLENTYFPRIKGFDKFTHYERAYVYGLGKAFKSESGFDKSQIFKSIKNSALLGVVSAYNFLKQNDYFLLDKNGCYTTLERNLYISRRVLNLCSKFGFSLDEYVTYIEKYYLNKKYDLLLCQMQFEENFVKSDFPSRLLFLDKSFLDKILTSNLYDLPEWYKITLSGFDNTQVFYDKFGRFDSKVAIEYFDERKIKSYNDVFRQYYVAYSRSLKKKIKNDYVDFERFKNFNSYSI